MSKSNVYLGYEDELITQKHTSTIDYKVNKIGGKPNWPSSESVFRQPKCALCSFDQLLVVQCYAPLEGSSYHRTLYLFACINVNCWEHSKGWTCYRSHVLDCVQAESSTSCVVMNQASNSKTSMNWCSEADDWDEQDDFGNGNTCLGNTAAATSAVNGISDEDHDSISSEVVVMEQELSNLKMTDTNITDEAGDSADGQGATALHVTGTAMADAELEGNEGDLVTVEDIPMPDNQLNFLLHQTAAFSSEVLESLSSGKLVFEAHFMSVEEEWISQKNNAASELAGDRVAKLLSRYCKENGEDYNDVKSRQSWGSLSKAQEEPEQYEDVAPLHGDRLFHAFVTKVQENPKQVLRYSHGGIPLLGAPLPHASRPCEKCGAKRAFEVQLMPSLSSSLRLSHVDSAHDRHSAKLSLNHLHFVSVLIFTCSKSCWTVNDYVICEEVVVQPQTF